MPSAEHLGAHIGPQRHDEVAHRGNADCIALHDQVLGAAPVDRLPRGFHADGCTTTPP
ncbi:hypothetical protein ABZ471_38120 [Streptomyces sp. NPDC005728]|uniref:hypothetical protein n=1 Tax=Streptomyces sp. NPDC005728 TaxID=3157054 RepID=UPI0033DAEFDA